MGTLIPFLISIFVFAGCGARLPTTFGDSRTEVVGGGAAMEAGFEKLSGTITLTDGTRVDLAAQQLPLVVNFVTYFCISCQEETKALSEYFKTRGLPKNVAIYTVLAGSGLERAKTWATKWGVSWSMAADLDSIFERICPEKLTPCLLTQGAGVNGKITKHLGITPIEQIELETGTWTY